VLAPPHLLEIEFDEFQLCRCVFGEDCRIVLVTRTVQSVAVCSVALFLVLRLVFAEVRQTGCKLNQSSRPFRVWYSCCFRIMLEFPELDANRRALTLAECFSRSGFPRLDPPKGFVVYIRDDCPILDFLSFSPVSCCRQAAPCNLPLYLVVIKNVLRRQGLSSRFCSESRSCCDIHP